MNATSTAKPPALSLVPLELVSELWPDAWPLIARTLSEIGTPVSQEKMRADVASGSCALWYVPPSDGPLSTVALGEVRVIDGVRTALVMISGKPPIAGAIAVLEAAARADGCAAMLLTLGPGLDLPPGYRRRMIVGGRAL